MTFEEFKEELIERVKKLREDDKRPLKKMLGLSDEEFRRLLVILTEGLKTVYKKRSRLEGLIYVLERARNWKELLFLFMAFDKFMEWSALLNMSFLDAINYINAYINTFAMTVEVVEKEREVDYAL